VGSIPGSATRFSVLHSFKTDFGVHSASYPMGSGNCFLWPCGLVGGPGREVDCCVLSTACVNNLRGYAAVTPTVVLHVVLYGCETWSLTPREERRLRVFENMVLRRIFGAKRNKLTGGWRKLHNEELNDLYCSPNIVRVIKSRRMGWAAKNRGYSRSVVRRIHAW
jgi:hypothetical protein